MGNSLNTSEEELHTAGITLAPKGTAASRQPICIQISLVLTLITITFLLIAIRTIHIPSTLHLELFCFYTTGPLPLWLWCWYISFLKSPLGVICAVMQWGYWLRCVCVCVCMWAHAMTFQCVKRKDWPESVSVCKKKECLYCSKYNLVHM